jgi:hypothetical protein
VKTVLGIRIRSDPDLFAGSGSGSGNFLPDPDRGSGSRIRIRPPKGAYYKSEKVIFSQQHFQYPGTLAFHQTMKKTSELLVKST